ncbi:MAG: hypothetical protein QME48_03230 [bacterium]|nr:hypothetical protein [bacterium]
MKDIFFDENFIRFFKLSKIETDFFLYPFLLFEYKGYKSISSLGYQGVIVKKDYSENEIQDFYKKLDLFRKEKSIVTEFIRYNPFLGNSIIFPEKIASSTFFIVDVEKNPKEYFDNLPSRTRNSIKKAKECITVKRDRDVGILKGSLNYKNEFFYDEKSLKDLLNTPFTVKLSAFLDGEEVASSLFFYSKETSYYIANFSNDEGKKNGANTLLIYEFYRYCYENKIKFLGLGGGFKDGDSLSFFKNQFSTRKTEIFHSKFIFDRKAYQKLSENIDGNYFPPYLKDVNLLKLSNTCSESD